MKYTAALFLPLLCLSIRAESLPIKATVQLAELDEAVEPKTQTAHGMCIPVSESRVLTCWHTLAGKETFEVQVGSEWHKARLLKHDSKEDLALLEVEGATLKPVKLAPSTGQTSGLWVFRTRAGMSGSAVMCEGLCMGMLRGQALLKESVGNAERPEWTDECEYVATRVIRGFIERNHDD